MITIHIQSRSGKSFVPNGVRLSEDSTVKDLMISIYDAMNRSGKFSPVRQRLTLPPAAGERSGKALESDKTLAFYGLKDGSIVQYKDLGIQVGYSFVFFWEYFGPLVIYPFFWSNEGRQLFYGSHLPPTTLTQDMAMIYWSLHYAKRIYETFHVHKFSHATMPIFNLFKNCSYYWAFAAFVSYFINHPKYTEPYFWQTVICFLLAYVCQAGNYVSHVMLSSLRGDGKSGYSIPRGFLFNYVTCANYTFEIWGWMLFSIATQSLPAAIFMLCGALQMTQWAIAKHKRLKKLFDGNEGREKYPRRWVILPPLL